MPSNKKSQKSSEIPRFFQNVQDVIKPKTLQFSGKIPSWVKGTLIANGTGTFDLEEGSVNHFIDAYTILAKYEINGNTLKYSSKHLETTAYKKALEAKKPVLVEFGTPPGTDKSKGFFSKLMIAFTPNDMSDNGVNKTVKIGSKIYGLGDTTYFHDINPTNLKINKTLNAYKTLGFTAFSSDVYKDKNGDTYLFGSTLKPTVHYTIKRMSMENKSEKLEEQFENVCSFPARWKLGSASVRNCFALTENYIIHVEVPLIASVLKLAATNVKGYSVSDWFEWKPEESNRFYIIHKASGKLIKTEIYSEKAFLPNAIINAFEDGDQIIFDVISYPDPMPVVEAWMNENIRTSTVVEGFTPGEIHRYKIPIVEDIKKCPEGTSLLNNSSISKNILKYPAEAKRVGDQLIVSPEKILEADNDNCFNFGIINGNYAGKKNSFIYGVPCLISSFLNAPTSFTVTKVDMDTGKVLRWQGKNDEFTHEPTFIPNPNSESEDDGILLFQVKNRISTEDPDFFVAVDPKTMEEIGRVEFDLDLPVAAYTHATFYPEL